MILSQKVRSCLFPRFFAFVFSVFLSLAPASGLPQETPVKKKGIAYFVDEAAKRGLTAQNTFGGVDTKKYIIETTGTGVAIFDYDNDGWPDIFVVNGTTLDLVEP